jgi:ADP-ribosyl-[dinitrogen reductase] hydrolase
VNFGSTENFAGCLLGGAVGDALGAPVEFASLAEIRARFGQAGITGFVHTKRIHGASSGKAKITDDTQMTLFTAEGLVRAIARQRDRGICDPVSVVYRAYIRWLHTQGLRSEFEFERQPDDGWLIQVRDLHHRRAPGSTCLSALRGGVIGTPEKRINSSKGCGGVMRIAPVGLVCGPERAFELGCEIAATTHGHPSGYVAAGCLACIISGIIQGRSLEEAIRYAVHLLDAKPEHRECSNAVKNAVNLATDKALKPAPEIVERLGQGWVAEEALAISLYCALVAEGDFTRGVLLAVNYGGDSDSTGAITGNVLARRPYR